MINPVHLRTLLEVVAHRSFATAATRLGYTASAVSQQMTALERSTGTTLFLRGARSITPTPGAMRMVRHAKRVLTDLDALMADVATISTGSSEREEIKLGIFPSLATYALPKLLTSEDWNALGINLRLWIGEPQQTVAGLGNGGDLDLALIFQVGPGGLSWPASLERAWLGDDQFRVVIPASWPIADDAQLTVDQLAEWPWIFHHPGTSDATLISRLFASYNIHPQVAAYCDDFNASLSLVSSGLGAALVPDLAMAQAPEGLRIVDAPEIRLARSIFALKPENSKKPKVDLVLDRLTQILSD